MHMHSVALRNLLGHADGDAKQSYLSVMPFMNRSKLLKCNHNNYGQYILLYRGTW